MSQLRLSIGHSRFSKSAAFSSHGIWKLDAKFLLEVLGSIFRLHEIEVETRSTHPSCSKQTLKFSNN